MDKGVNRNLILIADKEIKDSFKISRLSDSVFSTAGSISVVYNRIFVVSKGKGTLRIDNSNYAISGKELFLVSKGQTFSFSKNAIMTGFEISFGDCFWERTPASASNCKAALFNHASLNQRLALSKDDLAALDPICDLLFQEYESADYPNKLDAMASYLKVIMIKLANIHASSGHEINGFDNKLYWGFLELIRAKSADTREVAGFAKELSITSRKLSEVCKQKSGYSAKEIINSHIIAEAKRALQFSSKPIKEIASDLSFASPEQFSHFFKKNTEISPVDYRHLFVNIGR
jgi:AraC family transcriptional activator of pobA